jgi:Alginate lyase
MLRMPTIFTLAVLVVWVFATRTTAQSISLTKEQCGKLIQIVQSDPEAGRLFGKIRRAADEALGAEPNPIIKIQTEGKLPADPLKIATLKSLADMPRLDALAYGFAVDGKAEYASKAKQFILAWAAVNHSTGDPIDDTNLEPLLVCYDMTRSTFTPDDCAVVDTYLRIVATKEQSTGNNHYNNWNSHRLKIVGMIALLLQDKPLIDKMQAAYREQIDHNIYSDGSTYDFHERDALHYHIYDLTPLLTLAIAARNNGIDLYSYVGTQGGSLPKAMAFLLPYAQGTVQHGEFAHSKVSFDKKRADAGDSHFKAGTPFEPTEALSAVERAEEFDPSLLPLVIQLSRSDAKKYPNWQTVLNAARR